MAITVTGPLATPTNVVATPTAGGSLAASTTYYIRIVAKTGDVFYTIPFRDSPPSTEVSFVTTSTNKQCSVTWDSVTGATKYDVYMSTTSGSYSGQKLLHSANDHSPSTSSTNSYTITGAEYSVNSVAPFTSTQTFPFSITKEGTIQVNFDGTVTLTDIYNAIVAAGYSNYVFWDGGVFAINGAFYLTGSTAGSLTAYNVTFYFLRLSIYNNNANFTFNFGQATSYQTGDKGCILWFHQYGQRNFQGSKNINLSGCVTKGGSNYLTAETYLFNGDMYVRPSGTGCTYSGYTCMSGVAATELSLGFSPSDVTNLSGGRYAVGTGAGNGAVTETRPTVKGNQLSFYDLSANNDTYTINDPTVYGAGSDIMVRQSTKTIKIYNGQYKSRTDNIPIIQWLVLSGNTSNNAPLYMYNNLSITVVDANGSAISGATVNIYDNTGAEVTGSPLTTSATGTASLDILSDTRTAISSTSNIIDSSNNGLHYTPHTVVISKTGYTSRTVKYSMTQKLVEVEKLTQDGTDIIGSTLYGATIY